MSGTPGCYGDGCPVAGPGRTDPGPGWRRPAGRRQTLVVFDDLLAANVRYAEQFAHAGLEARAARGLGVVTCIDSRIEPLQMLGLVPGDAKILRNAGGRVTDDVLRSLILATNLLGVERVAVVHHTNCAMASPREVLVSRVEEAVGRPVGDLPLHNLDDPDADLADDVEAIRACPLIPATVEVVGWRYDVGTGLVAAIVG